MKLTSQKVDSLLQLLTSKESEELKELRKQRERAKSTETELTNAKKRISELESKIDGLVRSEVTTTRSLEDARTQIDSYQTKVEKLERELEPLRRLDEAQKARDNEFEQIRTQLTMQEKEEVGTHSILTEPKLTKYYRSSCAETMPLFKRSSLRFVVNSN